MPAHILLIEDNPANLELMGYLLRAYGHVLWTAEDGESGVAEAHRNSPDLIVCDVQLPRLDGFEVVRRLKATPTLQNVPVVAVTALAMVGDRDRILAAGFDGYVSKPINPETFVRQMEDFLPPGQRTTAPTIATPETSPAQGHRTGRTVLVVDNLPLNLDLARCILEPSGYQVVTATGIAEALAMARQHRCELILSDVCMSGETGYDFIRLVKADPQLAGIPFVFITSTLMDQRERLKGLALGAKRFLFRPIEPDVLLAEIEACLSEAGGADHGDHPDR